MVSPAGQRNERAGAIRLSFDRGTLLIEGVDPNAAQQLSGAIWDPRVASYRAPACKYIDIVQVLKQQGYAFLDLVSQRTSAPAASWAPIELRPYQQAALTAWELAGGRGVIVLPTGSGKTRLAVAALARLHRPALCLVPTRVPLTARSQHEQNRVQSITIGYAGVVATQRMLGPRRQQRFDPCPKLVGDPPAVILCNKSHAARVHRDGLYGKVTRHGRDQ